MRGILTAAYSHSTYLDQAVSLRISFLNAGISLPFSLVTNQTLYPTLKPIEKQFFDHILIKPDATLYDFRGKLTSALDSPYTETLYLDSDCLLLHHAEKFISLWFDHDFSVTGHQVTEGIIGTSQIKEILNIHNIKALPLFNAGVFGFNEQGRKIIENANQLMDNPVKHGIPKNDGGYNEQVALGIAMALKGIKPLVTKGDFHYSLHDAGTPLLLAENKIFFEKGGIWRCPMLLHYTPVFREAYAFSQSRQILNRLINPLRKKYGLNPQRHFIPSIRDLLALGIRGRFPSDPR